MGNILYIIGFLLILSWIVLLVLFNAVIPAFIMLYFGFFSIILRIFLGKRTI